MNGHMRIWTFLALCGWLAVVGAAAQAAGAGEAPGAGGAGLEKDFEMLFGAEAAKVAAGGHPNARIRAVAPSNRKPEGLEVWGWPGGLPASSVR